MKKLIYSAIKTPDGTILNSKYRHDYITHVDANGELYFLDGGIDYQRVSVNKEPFEDISIFDDAPHEVVRELIERGGRGKDGKEELRYVKLKDINDEWLENLVEYEKKLRPDNPYLKIYIKEREWRQQK